MKLYIYIFLHILLIISSLKSTSSYDKVYHKTRLHRNISEDCQPNCANKLSDDCNKFEIELRATIARCNFAAFPSISSTSAPKSEADENSVNCVSHLTCGKKLHATLKITNQGGTEIDNQYVIVDHVIDSISGQKVSLLNPYVIVFKQKPIQQYYGLKYKNAVNAEATEEVINKGDKNFRGCDDVSENPTCGKMKYNGDVIPYSQGFCCSCDDSKNLLRQPRSTDLEREKRNLTMNIQGLIYDSLIWDNKLSNSKNLKELIRKKKSVESRDFNDYRTSFQFRGRSPAIYITPKLSNEGKYRKNSDLYMKEFRKNYNSFNTKPSIQVLNQGQHKHHVQIRGGQDCNDARTLEEESNPTSYYDSAHCLRFSSLWYIAYKLSEPVLDHCIFIKIFQKREVGLNTMWVDLTSGKAIEIGTLTPKFEDSNMIISYDSFQKHGDPLPFALDSKENYILIPQDTSDGDCTNHPECESGAPEYLVVDTDNIHTSGDQCDTAGVGYTAFFNQPNRCSVRKGACLRNQPSELWRQDRETCSEGGRGKYFLKNFAIVPNDAIRKTSKRDSKYLALEFNDLFQSSIDIEIKADDNIPLRSLPLAKITEIYVDSTGATSTIITIKIHNNGLTSNVFRPRLTDCPLELPVEWGNFEADPKLIPPQHHSTFTLQLLGILPVNNFYCSVEALNSRNEIIAVRRIRVVKSDRCICSWHCLCACFTQNGLGCVLMSMEHYKAAGFIGSMPLTTTMVQASYLEQVVFGFLFFVLMLVIILLLMGLTKALIGFCFFAPVGIWGLDMLIGVGRIRRYYEDELARRRVIYDEDGWPIHPDTKTRTVRIVDARMEFCLNVIFFFTYPVMLIVVLFLKICCPYYTYCGEDEFDKGMYFESVNTVSYTKCPGASRPSSESDLGNEDMFEFEETPQTYE